jgi:hypothetical protein
VAERTKALPVCQNEHSVYVTVLEPKTSGEKPQHRDRSADGRETTEAILRTHLSVRLARCYRSQSMMCLVIHRFRPTT